MVAVFVDGCFWHGCPVHGHSASWGGPNAHLWKQKLERTRARDSAATSTAQSIGWKVIRFWECEVLTDPDAAAKIVLANAHRDSVASGVTRLRP